MGRGGFQSECSDLWGSLGHVELLHRCTPVGGGVTLSLLFLRGGGSRQLKQEGRVPTPRLFVATDLVANFPGSAGHDGHGGPAHALPGVPARGRARNELRSFGRSPSRRGACPTAVSHYCSETLRNQKNRRYCSSDLTPSSGGLVDSVQWWTVHLANGWRVRRSRNLGIVDPSLDERVANLTWEAEKATRRVRTERWAGTSAVTHQKRWVT